MSNELALINSVDDLGRIGTMMAKSGYFTDARDAAQASVKVMAGMEMGFGAFASMTGIYIIQGKPSVGANLMASAVKANPKYDYKVREISGQVCRIEFFERVDGKLESIGTSEFTLQEAKVAGVKNLDKYARNMLFARAMSNGIRWFCPDVFQGNVTYTPEELGADVDGEGNVVSIEEAKAQTPVIEAQEPVIEGEIIEPINNTPAKEKPVEAQEKPEFDEHEFLRNYQHKAGLPGVTLDDAMKMETTQGIAYGKMGVKQLYYMSLAIQKKMDAMQYEPDKEPYKRKLGAVNTLLSKYSNELKLSEMPEDPFMKKGNKNVQDA